MTDEAFKRRFYEDRAELAALGIEIAAETRPARPAASSTACPPTPTTCRRSSSTATSSRPWPPASPCSRTASPTRSRCAWRCSACRRGGPSWSREAATPPLTVVPEADEDAALAALPKLQAAVADRKTVKFEYYAISRDEAMARIVDPYGLQLVAGEWYLIGWCHLREGMRTFRLSRIRSRVTHAHARAARLLCAGRTSTSAPTATARPGSWRGRGRRRAGPRLGGHGVVGRGALGALRHGRARSDGAIVFETPYADARPLLAWVLGLAEAAEVLAPQTCATRSRCTCGASPTSWTRRRRSGRRRSGAGATQARQGAGASTPGLARGGRPLHPSHGAHHLPAAQLRRRRRPCCDVADVRADLDVDRETLRADVRLLNLVNFGADGALLYAEFEGREQARGLLRPGRARASRGPPASRRCRRTRCCWPIELVGRPAAHRRRGGAVRARPPSCGPRARRRPDPRHAATCCRRPTRCSTPSTRAIVERRLLAIEYWTEGTDHVTEPHRRALPAACTAAASGTTSAGAARPDGTRVFRVATTKSGAAARRDLRAARRTSSSTSTGARASRRRPATRRGRRPCGTAPWCVAGSPSASRCGRSPTARAWRASPTWT